MLRILVSVRSAAACALWDEPQARTVLAHFAALTHYPAREPFGAHEVVYHKGFFAVRDDLDLAVTQKQLDGVLAHVYVAYLPEGEHDVHRAANAGAEEEFVLRHDYLLHIKGDGVHDGKDDDEHARAQQRPSEIFGGEIFRFAREVGVQPTLDVVAEHP